MGDQSTPGPAQRHILHFERPEIVDTDENFLTSAEDETVMSDRLQA
jgi:hypothetical protein